MNLVEFDVFIKTYSDFFQAMMICLVDFLDRPLICIFSDSNVSSSALIVHTFIELLSLV